MGMVIRTAFNNQNWNGKCKDAENERFFYCKVVDTGYGIDDEGNCSSEVCFESKLCKEYIWRNTIGNFGKKAEGQVFFIFRDHKEKNAFVLWGMTQVKKVDGNRVYFKEFKPFPQEKWIRRLSLEETIGRKKWGQGTYRYIDVDKESKLRGLLNKN